MAQRAGRIVCPRCGTNNFDTVTVCWKCNTPLGAGSAAAPAMPTAAPPVSTPSVAPPPLATPSLAERAVQYPVAAMVGAGLMGNPSAANRAAVWLGLLFPYFGLPIGLAFMMCDDRRRQEVGRICILWSLVSGVFHLLLMFVSFLGMREYFAMALNTVKGQLNRSGGGFSDP